MFSFPGDTNVIKRVCAGLAGLLLVFTIIAGAWMWYMLNGVGGCYQSAIETARALKAQSVDPHYAYHIGIHAECLEALDGSLIPNFPDFPYHQ